MIYEHFAITDKDRDLVDQGKLQQLRMINGNIRDFIYRWDAILINMRKKPDDETLLC